MKSFISVLLFFSLFIATSASAEICQPLDITSAFKKIRIETPSPEYSGIGMQPMTSSKSGFKVLTVFEGSPAEKAGLMPSDELIAVDGKPVAGMTMNQMISHIKGDAGTSVDITIQRRGQEPLNVHITRAMITGAYQWYDRRYYKRALKMALPLAGQGMPKAQNILGVLYESGIETPKDIAKATEWYRKAAEQGDDYAQYNLGMLLAAGKGMEQDRKEALRWMQKSAQKNNWQAYKWIENFLKEELAAKRPVDDVMDWYREFAATGNSDGQYQLGLLYANGSGVQQNDAEAASLMRKAAAQGSDGARQWLRERLSKPAPRAYGPHDPSQWKKDWEEVENLYKAQAEKNDASSQHDLANLLFRQGKYADAYLWMKLYSDMQFARMNDRFFPWNEREMLGMIEKESTTAQLATYRKRVFAWRPQQFPALAVKALKGDIPAAQKIAEFYRRRAIYDFAGPEYRQRAFADAIKWQEVFARTGDVTAQLDLAKLYARKNGPNDSTKSEKWFRMAAEHGNGEAMAALANIIIKENGNKDEALKWLYRAIETQDGRFHAAGLLKRYGDGKYFQTDEVAAYKWQIITHAHNSMSEGEDIFSPDYYFLKKRQEFTAGMTAEQVAEAEKLAQDWLLLQANGGDARAQYALGKSYAIGMTGKQDLEEAYFWIVQSIDTNGYGSINADIRPTEIAVKLTPEQLAKVEKRLDDCMQTALPSP